MFYQLNNHKENHFKIIDDKQQLGIYDKMMQECHKKKKTFKPTLISRLENDFTYIVWLTQAAEQELLSTHDFILVFT